MEVCLYGKDGCSKCESAAEKLDMLLGADNWQKWSFEDVGRNWRDQEYADAMSFHVMHDGEMPVIMIDREAYSYPEAMKILKGEK